MPVLARGDVFVHIAPHLRFDGARLTLVDVAPSTIWLSQGDPRQLTYLPTGAYLDRWAELEQGRGPEGGRVRGTLSLLDADARIPGRAVLELSGPRMRASGLAYDVRVVEGIVPTHSGACVLFLEWDEPPGAAAEPSPRQPPEPRRQAP